MKSGLCLESNKRFLTLRELLIACNKSDNNICKKIERVEGIVGLFITCIEFVLRGEDLCPERDEVENVLYIILDNNCEKGSKHTQYGGYTLNHSSYYR